MSKPIIPFGTLPGHWGLKGKTRERAQADYELEGMELELRLNEIDNTGDIFKATELAIKLSYDAIDEKTYDFAIAEMRDDPETMLRVKLKHNEIGQNEFDKEFCSLKGEPWVDVSKINFSLDEPGAGNLELDWNDTFIEMIQEAGYTAGTAEGSVDLWLNDLCRNIALEELAGQGVFEEDSYEALKIKRKRLDDGTVEVR